MATIKRVKAAPTGPMGALTGDPAAVHYATRIDPNGNVLGWSLDAAAALDVTAEAMARVRAQYASRGAAAGVITFEGEPAEPAAAVAVATAGKAGKAGEPPAQLVFSEEDMRAAVDEVHRLREANSSLRSENDELRRMLDAATAPATAVPTVAAPAAPNDQQA